MTDRYEITLVRNANVDTAAPTRRLRAFRRMPATASSDRRASAELRRLSDEVIAEHPQLEWSEVLCRQHGEPSEQPDEVPAIALVDRRFPILICLYDTSAFLSIDTELTASSIRGVFRHAQAYVALFYRSGYSTLVDHETGAVSRVSDALPKLTERLRDAGRRRWLGRVHFDSRVWFISGWVGVGLIAAIADGLHGRRHSFWQIALVGLPFGAIAAALQYWYERSLLHDRLREIRNVVTLPSGSAEPLRFAVPKIGIDILVTIVVLGSFATGGWIAGDRSTAIFIAAAGLANVTYLLLSDRAYVVIDARGVEGLGKGGRLYLPFEDIDRIDQSLAFEIGTVSSAVLGTVWIPRKLSGRHQLLEILTERVDAACRTADDAEILTDAQVVAIVEHELGQARPRFWFGRASADRARRPILLSLMHHHPLRAQYSWRRHLLVRGQVALAHIVLAPHTLRTARLDQADPAHSVLVTFSVDREWQAGRDLSRAVAAILTSEEQGEHLGEEIACFRTALGRNAGFPLLVRVPPALIDGHTVYCTSLMMNGRDVPLGYLRSWWLPVLVDPRACQFAVVVPLRYWGASVRRQWKRGAGTLPSPG